MTEKDYKEIHRACAGNPLILSVARDIYTTSSSGFHEDKLTPEKVLNRCYDRKCTDQLQTPISNERLMISLAVFQTSMFDVIDATEIALPSILGQWEKGVLLNELQKMLDNLQIENWLEANRLEITDHECRGEKKYSLHPRVLRFLEEKCKKEEGSELNNTRLNATKGFTHHMFTKITETKSSNRSNVSLRRNLNRNLVHIKMFCHILSAKQMPVGDNVSLLDVFKGVGKSVTVEYLEYLWLVAEYTLSNKDLIEFVSHQRDEPKNEKNSVMLMFWKTCEANVFLKCRKDNEVEIELSELHKLLDNKHTTSSVNHIDLNHLRFLITLIEGRLFFYKGKEEKSYLCFALEHLNEAEDKIKQLPKNIQKRNLHVVFHLKGAVYLEQEKLEQAEKYFAKALDQVRSYSDSVKDMNEVRYSASVAFVVYKLGIKQNDTDKINKALNKLDSCVETFKNIGDELNPDIISILLSRSAIYYDSMKDFQKALDDATRAKNIACQLYEGLSDPLLIKAVEAVKYCSLQLGKPTTKGKLSSKYSGIIIFDSIWRQKWSNIVLNILERKLK